MAKTAEQAQIYIYIVTTQTGTILSQLLKIVTGAQYNHSSLSLQDDLQVMWSFGRRRPYNPFWGGFVRESPQWGTFKRFSETEAAVVQIQVEEAQYRAIAAHLADMYRERGKYRYDLWGLILAAFQIRLHRRNYFYCSEFIRDVLVRFQVIEEGALGKIVKPVDLLELENSEMVYQGKLRLYAGPVESASIGAGE